MSIAIPSLDDLARDAWADETLTTADGFPIAARFYYPPTDHWRGAVLIVPAMGVPQRYYHAFARWLAERGHLVATFDYRGMGRSRRGPLRRVEADIFTWAEQDTAAVLTALADRAPRLPLTWIGHSLGGQILPFTPNRQRVSKVITVGSGSGYWKENSPPLKRKVWLLWFGVAPLTLPLFGYFPGNLFGMVGDLPQGVMAQWRRWCLHPEYAVGVEGESVREKFAAVKTPMLSLSFTDDEFMSAENTASLHGFYRGADPVMLRLDPAEEGVKRIGHFGFFKPDMAVLWERWIDPERHGS